MNDAAAEESNRLAENIMHFARVLRAAGLPVGPGKVLDGVRAVISAGVINSVSRSILRCLARSAFRKSMRSGSVAMVTPPT